MGTQESGIGVTHTFLAHHSGTSLAECVRPFIREGLDASQPVHVNAARHHLANLRAALGEDGGKVTWTDTDEWVPHPGRRLRAIEDLLEQEAARGRRLRFVGSCAWPVGPEALVREWERFDVALGELLEQYEASMVCLYDADALPADVIDRARHFHPEHGLRPARPNPGFGAPRATLRDEQHRLALPGDAVCLSGRVTPGTARRFLHDLFASEQLEHERVEELTVIASELVTNSVQAGAETITIAWWEDEDGCALQVDDDGYGFDEPLAGYRRPAADADNGRGVWIARQLADVVELARRDPGTSVRVHVYDADRIVRASQRGTPTR